MEFPPRAQDQTLCLDLTRSQRWQARPVSSKTQGQQSLFLIFSFTLYHTSSSAMCLRPLGQGKMETGKRCATSIPMCQTIAGTQLNGNQKRLFRLIQFLLPEYRAIPHPEMKPSVLEIRVYFGLILWPSAGSILKSLSFRQGSWRVR